MFDNGHFICLDHNSKSIVVSFRGTFHIRDALVDLAGRNEPFMVNDIIVVVTITNSL